MSKMKRFLCKACTIEHYQFGEDCDEMVCDICGNTDWSPRELEQRYVHEYETHGFNEEAQ